MKVLIFGNGGHARVVVDILQTMDGMEPVGVIYSGPVAAGETMAGLPVISEERIPDTPHDAMVIALGDNAQRKNIYATYLDRGETLVSAIHPAAVIAADAVIEPGCMVCAGAVVNPGCRIKVNTILNTGCTVDHDCVVGPHVHVAPGVNLAGTVTVEEGVFLGIGSCVVQGMTIGADSTVGAGGAVIRNVRPKTTVVGVPAREIQE